MTSLMGASGAESLNVAASIFMGQTEAPLTIRPFLPDVTRSELMTIMTSGMAHVSGGMMAAYIAYGIQAKHLLAAVIMTAPGTILLAKILVPETEKPLTAGRVEIAEMERDANILGAISRGTVDGLHLALNVAAMLISFIALIYLVDGCFGGAHNAARRAWSRVVSFERRANFWLDFFSRRLADRHPLARLSDDWQSAGPADGDERICRVPAARTDAGRARPALLHDRHVRALRIREFQLDRHPDWRHRRSRAE